MMTEKVKRPPVSHIARLVKLHGGDAAAAALLGDKVKRQQFGQWVQRGYFSPFRLDDIRPLLTKDITEEHLKADIVRNGKRRGRPPNKPVVERRKSGIDRRKAGRRATDKAED